MPGEVPDTLRTHMAWVRELVSLGLQVRTQAKLRVRQPLRSAKVLVTNPQVKKSLLAQEAIIREELNVLGVDFAGRQ